MKILITGGTGFIGRHLVEYWKNSNHSITVLARHIDASLFDENTGCLEADITVKESIQAAIIFLQPDVVIHTAALSKPNDCEVKREECYLTNVIATEHIAAACKAAKAKLIFLSTDFVFSNNGPYTEVASCEPVNYYGESKRLAEEAIRANGVSYAIVRTGLVVGYRLKGQPNTFMHWVKENLEAGKGLRLYTDQQRSPTFITDLCNGMNAIIKTRFTGTIHLSGSEIMTPYSLAQRVANYFKLNQNLLHPITFEQQPELALRPQNAVLKIDKAVDVLSYTVTPFNEILLAVFPE